MVSDLPASLFDYLGQVFCGQQLDELRVFNHRLRFMAGRQHVYT
jgi:hypothetical protein